MKILSRLKVYTAFLVLLVLVGACEMFEEETKVYTESPKSVVGSWKIVKAYRNEVDITALMDFSQFRINFQENSSYTIENYIPFLVDGQGTYTLDDPQFPFHISFNVENEAEPLVTVLNYPIVDGHRQIGLTFSPGCRNNSYTYVLENASN
ncbi:DUF5004 domain-containing protein [Sunxiuqinia sp. A32]|uniref:DUF5004 domain-containing protein n=1 Tax=Sunxiuqinia sp. A32 TaxID=3461496 RepID=UPI004045665D